MNIVKVNHNFNGSLKNRSNTRRIIVHHSASDHGDAKTFHVWHLGNAWAGIGYHFIILKNGTIETGRPQNTIGAHAGPAGNPDSIGVCLVGNLDNYAPTEQQLNALVWLINKLKSEYRNLQVIGHKDVMATACPGKYFPWSKLHQMLTGPAQASNPAGALPKGFATAEIDYLGKIGRGIVINETVFVPLRQFAEQFEKRTVGWDGKLVTVR